MNNDGMRTHLVTVFRCADCGTTLKLSHEGKKSMDYVADGITGAAKVEQNVFIHPCQKCMKPSQEIKAALKTLFGSAAGHDA
ncbi:hypothetical protein BSR09_00740 [Stutzerimonas degradans]|nr:hypothetical protein BSR09_00740 [Stutzerimonas degradans]